MSDFGKTYSAIIHNEGGWAPAFGASGETYKGIDRKFYPQWEGWKIVDKAKPLQRYAFINNDALEKNVQDFYFMYLGEIVNLQNIINQTLADFIGDFLIHKRYDAIKVVNATALQLQPGIITDKLTITDAVVTLMNWNTPGYYALMYNNRIAYYQNPKQFGSAYSGFSSKILTAFIERVKVFPAAIL